MWGLPPVGTLTNARRPCPALDRGPKGAAAPGAGPRGGTRRRSPVPPLGLGADVTGTTRLVGPEAGAGPGSCSGAARQRGTRPEPGEAAAGAMAAPSPGPREVGADPREDRKGKGWRAGAGPRLPVHGEHTPIQAQKGSCTGRDWDTPHMGPQV